MDYFKLSKNDLNDLRSISNNIKEIGNEQDSDINNDFETNMSCRGCSGGCKHTCAAECIDTCNNTIKVK